jgi:tripartite-type tricarboxylate transporter receptor subunit TctC
MKDLLLRFFASAIVLCVVPVHVAAQDDWPRRPVRVILPAGPGGTSDILLRGMSEQVGKALGQALVFDNRAGAGGTLAATLAAQSEADGYTVMVASAATHGIAPFMYKLKFDPDKNVTGIAHLAFTPNVLYVRKDAAFRSVRELIAYARANPKKLNYSSSGSGTSLHLAAVQFNLAAGIEAEHVPYSGAAPSMQAVLAGDIAYSFENAIAVMGQFRAGSLLPLAVTTSTRSPQLPDVPTVAESGLAGFDVSGWFGIVAPGGVPRPIVDKLAGAFEAAVRNPQVIETVRKLGAEPRYIGPREFDAFMKAERQKWEPVVKASGASVN